MTMSPPNGAEKPTHEVTRDPTGAPVVGTDIGLATAIADVGRQRHDGNPGADLANRFGDRIALRDGHDQSVMTRAEVADCPRQDRWPPRVELVQEKLHVEVAVGAVGGGEGVLHLGVERIVWRLDQHGDPQSAGGSLLERPIELQFARPLDRRAVPCRDRRRLGRSAPGRPWRRKRPPPSRRPSPSSYVAIHAPRRPVEEISSRLSVF